MAECCEADDLPRVAPSLYALIAEEAGIISAPGRTVKTATIETSDESAAPFEPLTGFGS